MIVAVIEVWSQCSADYDAVRSTATFVCNETTTVAELMQWGEKINALGRGDIRLTQSMDEEPSRE